MSKMREKDIENGFDRIMGKVVKLFNEVIDEKDQVLHQHYEQCVFKISISLLASISLNMEEKYLLMFAAELEDALLKAVRRQKKVDS